MTQTFDPYSSGYAKSGTGTSSFGFTGEQTDSNGFVYLRARYYNPGMGRFLNTDPSRQEMNPYQYSYSNPTNYTDPSGLIAQTEEAAADKIKNDVMTIYGVEIEKDWGSKTCYAIQWWPPAIVSYTNWEPGRWEVIELQTVEAALFDLATLMGGPAQFKLSIGYVKVVMAQWTCGRGCTQRINLNVEFLDGSNPPTTVDIVNGFTIDKWTVVHEFGHAWDRNFNWRISKKLESYTKGRTDWWAHLWLSNCDADKRLPGCNDAGYFYGGVPPNGSDARFNSEEDFAESVAAAVYPAQAQSGVQKYQKDPLYKNLLYYADYKTTARWDFVNGLINGTIIP